MTDTQITIRPATAADARSIAQLYGELHGAEWHGRPPFPIALEAFLEEVEAVLASPEVRVLVAAMGPEVIGTARVELASRPYGPIAEIRRVVVTEAWRRRGVATRLMAGAEEAARALGTGSLRLTVVSSNAEARRFYAGLGYEEFAVRYRKRTGGADEIA
jgi:ribosomal protein S18 acetylase RimI-like enzyme